jgi:hypothetical protein
LSEGVLQYSYTFAFQVVRLLQNAANLRKVDWIKFVARRSRIRKNSGDSVHGLNSCEFSYPEPQIREMCAGMQHSKWVVNYQLRLLATTR